MNREMILKLLASLGIKIAAKDTTPREGELKEDDAVKLVEDLFTAQNLGLIQKRDELLEQEKKLKEKIAGLENAATDAGKTKAELEAQLKKSNPEEYKAFYEGKAKELEGKHIAELEKVNVELNRYRDSHFERVRNDQLTEATKDIQFIEGLKDGFVALALSKNQFKPMEVDGRTTFTNQNNETIEAVIRQFALSKEGKAFIKNGNQGSGAQGGTNQSASGQGGTTMGRNDFDALSDQAKMEFTGKGGTVTD
jgi:hypothetical protein